MRLTDLEPEFLVCLEGGDRMREVAMLAEAQGICFLCPKCFVTRGGSMGCHSVIVWFADRGVPAGTRPAPDRWKVAGTNFSDLTLSPSIHLTGGGCGWHGWIRAGEAS